MPNNPDQVFEVGDRVKFVLRNGKIAEGVVRAIIPTTKRPVLNVSFGPKGDLTASVNARQVVEKLTPLKLNLGAWSSDWRAIYSY
jgi:hypothetical protein